ncbi:MAG: putative rane protein [Desulfacinum sp.]|nr:putative rane protein [Desulfacinum sp.]
MAHGQGPLKKNCCRGLVPAACLLLTVLLGPAPSVQGVGPAISNGVTTAARARALLAIADPLPAVTLHVEEASYKIGPFALEGVRARITLERTAAGVRIQVADGRVGRLFWDGGGSKGAFEMGNLTFRGRAAISRPSGMVTLEELAIGLPRVGALGIRGTAVPGKGLRLDLHGRELELRHLLRGPLEPGRDWELLFPANLQATWVQGASGSWELSGHLRLEKASFHDSLFLHAGEGLGGSIGWRLEGGSGAILGGRMEARASAGEILWDRFYLNLSKHPVSMELRGDVDPAAGRWSVQGGALAVQGAAVIRLLHSSGALAPWGGRFHVSLADQEVGPLLDLFLRQPLEAEVPWLAAVRWAGRLGADLHLWIGAGLERALGSFRLQDGAVRIPEKAVNLTGLHLECPVWYERVGPSAADGSSPSGKRTGSGPGRVPPKDGPSSPVGRLSWQGAEFSGFKLGPATLRLEALPNGMRLPEAVRIPWDGQTVLLGPGGVQDVWTSNRQGRIRIHADPLDLSPLLPTSLQGAVRPVVHLADQEVVLRGERIVVARPFTVDLFSGTGNVERLEVRHVLSEAREGILDASWINVNLEELTRATAFGRITGKLKGRVTNLRFAYGAPIGFDLVLESEDDSPVERKISVTAIDNLAQVGTAQSPFVGMASLLKVFFKDFPYQKIGIRCRLENDYFTVRGLVHEGGREYLVRRGLVRGVNVINQNPRNRISWNDMVARLSRIGKSGKARVQ